MTWQISFSVPHWAVSLFDDLIHSKGYCMTAFKNNEKPDSGAVIWLFEIFFEDELNKVSILSEVSVFAAFHRVQLGKVSVLKVPETDWLTENLSSFKPFAIERFWIYGSHQPKTMPSGSLRLCVNASRAFGTGEHETTQGCLIALHDLQKSRSFSRLITASRFASVLDVGCGTAILAMASVRLWSCRALAVDIDPDAIVVARDLVSQNGLSQKIEVIESDGVQRREILRQAPYHLIIANILARPLCSFARGFAGILSPRGRIVLSGILLDQISMIVATYRVHNLIIKEKYIRGEWATLILGKN